jgi:hypothetical protein
MGIDGYPRLREALKMSLTENELCKIVTEEGDSVQMRD